jgi:hypothetical protein
MIRRGLRWSVVVVVGLLFLGVAGCGDGGPPTAEQRKRALAAGFDVDLVYLTEVDGYLPGVGGNGVYGDDDYQARYASSRGDDLALTVERLSLDAATCATLPIPGSEPGDAPVQCTRDGDGWRRAAGGRQEYAVTHGDLLVRVSGTSAATVRSAAIGARPATADELDELLPPLPAGVVRGDITGDNAPNNDIGAGG